MTTNTQINITAKDSTAAAFASANKGLSGLSSGAAQAAVALAGVGLSFGGLAASIKSSIDAADQTLELSQKIGVAVEQIAGLELAFKQSGLGADQLQSSISKLSKNVASGSSAFDAMGIATRGADGNLKSTRQILAEVSDKFAGYEDGIAKTALAMEIFGKSGSDLIPFLNEGSASLAEFDAMAQKLGLTLSTDTAKKADEFNDTIGLIQGSFAGLSNRVAAEMLPTLQGLAEQFFNTATQGGNVTLIASSISTALKGLVGVALGAAGAFKTVGTTLGGVAAMWGAIASGEFSQASAIVKQIKADFSENFKSTIDNVSNAWKANGSATVAALTATQKQVQIQAPLTSEIEKSTKSIEKQSKALNFQVGNLKELQDIYSRVQSITKGVETEQERYNSTLEELNRLKPYLGTETYVRALEKAQKELKGTEVQTRTTTDEVSQLWMQAGRNIQSTLANSIFNFFDDGLKGMLKNVISTVGRIASEFAALKVAQGVGLAGLFGASGAANASTSALSLASIGSGAANLGSSALNLFKVGGGISQGVSGLLGIGSSGTQAAAEAGATALWGTSGASASIGSSIASFAGPAIAVAAVDQIVRMLVGDKTLGGTAGKVLNFVPVLGPLINGLFGRGPIKQQGTLLEGQIGAEGFESGFLQTRFKQQGGAFRSDKIDFSRVDAVTGETFTDNGKLAGFTAELAEAGKQIFDSINEATKQTTVALRGVASTLGLATGGIDDFSYSLKILTEKGEMIQGEQIAEEIAKISEGLAKSLLPGVEEFQRTGETALNTLVRLSGEFTVLTSAAGLLFDKSSQWSKDFVNQFSIGARSAFLEQAGGADAFAANAAGFAQNFFTEAQVMKPFLAALASARDEQGLSGLNTRQQVADAVRSGNLSAEQTLFLVSNQAAIDQAFDYLEKFNVAIEETADAAIKSAVAIFSIARDADSTEQGQRLNASINETAQAIAELEGIASQLSGTVNSINPLSTDQARAIVSSGNPYDPNLQNALSVLSTSDNNNFGSKLDLQRSNALNIGAINSLQNSVAANISAKQAQKSQFEFEKQMLQVALNNAATMFNVLAQTSKTAEILDRVTAGGGAMLVENV